MENENWQIQSGKHLGSPWGPQGVTGAGPRATHFISEKSQFSWGLGRPPHFAPAATGRVAETSQNNIAWHFGGTPWRSGGPRMFLPILQSASGESVPLSTGPRRCFNLFVKEIVLFFANTLRFFFLDSSVPLRPSALLITRIPPLNAWRGLQNPFS